MRVATIVGTRPQIVKAAPLGRALAANGITELLVHTGQHYDSGMSDVFFADLEMRPPDHHLGIGGGSHGEMTGRMIMAIEGVLIAERPDAVVVLGDTNSTLAGALAAAKLQIPVVHVEAGLRSFNRAMPEEINRVVTDHVSSLLLCPTRNAVKLLAREGISQGVHHVGDVMLDAVMAFREKARLSDILVRIGVAEGGYCLATIHRAENTDDPGRLAALLGYLRKSPPAITVLALHPRTRDAVTRYGLTTDGLLVTTPLPYLDMIRLVEGAQAVYTDSGGLQKEAYFLGTPCVTLRSETEWPETVSHGWNRLWTIPDYEPRCPIDDFGDGRAAERSADLVASAIAAPGRRPSSAAAWRN
jgi:UDP-GlcNAc3NAcA epimerase